jgi:hypothetical protein
MVKNQAAYLVRRGDPDAGEEVTMPAAANAACQRDRGPFDHDPVFVTTCDDATVEIVRTVS